MSHLVLELRQGEMMVVNGATILFRNKCRIELVSQARFLFGKQIMMPGEADTDLCLLYYKLQIAYAGPAEDRAEAASDVRLRLAALQQQALGTTAVSLLSVAEAFEAEDFYKALKLLRLMVRDEKADANQNSEAT
ncbi:flagellar biosynthesis repressor FlbT [Lichenicola sp.]|uniref:flagellar biosynthesis repressor FlbT n=1 Tax=Lichenicola sp. TaxID=2804529 RepID=UPI003B008467